MMSTTFDLPGYKVDRQVGLCWGVLVRSVGFAKGFTGGRFDSADVAENLAEILAYGTAVVVSPEQ